jgi:hypothetical protein
MFENTIFPCGVKFKKKPVNYFKITPFNDGNLARPGPFLR